jgi:hypothetical protein
VVIVWQNRPWDTIGGIDVIEAWQVYTSEFGEFSVPPCIEADLGDKTSGAPKRVGLGRGLQKTLGSDTEMCSNTDISPFAFPPIGSSSTVDGGRVEAFKMKL